MKKILVFTLSLLIAFSITLSVYATDKFIFDEADYLTDDATQEIESLLFDFSYDTDYSIYFLSIYRPDETVDTNGFAKNFVHSNALEASGKSGLLCVLDLNNETHAIYDFGESYHIFSHEFVTAFNYSLAVAYTEDNYKNAFCDAVTNTKRYLEDGTFDFLYSQITPEENNSEQTFNRIYIADDADLFTDEQETELYKLISKINFYHDIDVVLHTTNSIGGKDIVDYADDYYDYNGFAEDGMLFMVDMSTRNYYTSTTGYPLIAFTDEKLEELHSVVVPYLSDGEYYEAFTVYLENIDGYLEAIHQEQELSYSFNDSQKISAENIIKREIIVIGVSLLIAFFIVGIFKKQMNTAVKKTQANDYLVPGTLNITTGNDYFLTSSVVRTPKQQSTSSGGGGSHRSSSGRSHGGGGGKF